MSELVLAQNRHVERLQSKIANPLGMVAVNRVREG